MSQVLEDPANRKIKAELEKTVALVPSNPEQHLAKCRELAASVTIPEALRAELTAAMESMDMPLPKGKRRRIDAAAAASLRIITQNY